GSAWVRGEPIRKRPGGTSTNFMPIELTSRSVSASASSSRTVGTPFGSFRSLGTWNDALHAEQRALRPSALAGTFSRRPHAGQSTLRSLGSTVGAPTATLNRGALGGT